MQIILHDRSGNDYELEVRRLEDGCFELLETPLCLYPLAALGDIVRLRLIAENTYRLQRVVERPLSHVDLMIPGEYGYSDSIHDFGRWICARGGGWECVAAGLLFLHLPTGLSKEEVVAELESRLETFRDSDERAAILEKDHLKERREQHEAAMRRLQTDKVPDADGRG